MKLIIAEKPDQGLTLASIFQMKKMQGYIEVLPNDLFPNGAYVTWAIGHITQLVSPEKYNPSWKKWSLLTLPMVPSTFQYEVCKDKWKQFSIIKNLLENPKVTEVIHAGDAGREGELIVRNILRQTECKKPMKRLWISSLTPKSIRKGFESLLSEEETRNLFFEAYTRACADWIVGMNASRLYSLLLKNKGFEDVFSVGRVQTPTLALIVKREREIESFVIVPFWEVIATFQVKGKKYSGKWIQNGETRITTQELASKIATFCEEKVAEIIDVKAERKEFLPPLLYNLSALQAEANRRFKMSPKKTLDTLQKLYQKGFISYPRSDSRYVTKGEAEAFPEILNKISALHQYASYFPLPKESVLNDSRYVDDKKVTDHYAIIPTEQIPNLTQLNNDEQKLYDCIVKSLIAIHYPKSIAEFVTLETMVDGRAQFLSKGKMVIEDGWRRVIPLLEKEKDLKLPNLSIGDVGTVKDVEVKESKTQPPKRYTEGQLITLMKTAGKHIEDKELEKILMKTEGLGTEATRASIITMLKDRKYLDVKKNIVYPTAKAQILIRAVGEELLASPEMTAKWEQRLKEISMGNADPKIFMLQTNKMIAHLISSTINTSEQWEFQEEWKENFVPRTTKGNGKKKVLTVLGACKKCSGTIIDKGKFYGCSKYQDNKCDFTISKKILGKSITQKLVKQILTEGKTELIQGFKGKEKLFQAKLMWDEKENKIKFIFEQ